MTPLLDGIWLGLAYAMPIGAQNVFVINAASKGGVKNALRVAAIVSLMDVSLAIACFSGVGEVLKLWPILNPVMSTVGALFLFYVGWSLLRAEDSVINESDKALLPLSTLIKTAFVLTWFNPQALIDGTMLFGGVRGGLEGADIGTFIVGAAFGSIIWFFTICTIVGVMKNPVPKPVLKFINVGCGLALMTYGVKLATVGLL